jgi:hypothetical protein
MFSGCSLQESEKGFSLLMHGRINRNYYLYIIHIVSPHLILIPRRERAAHSDPLLLERGSSHVTDLA